MTATGRFEEVFGGWTPQAVVFDCDGLLLDTESVWERAQDAAIRELQVPLQDEDHAQLHGAALDVVAALFAERTGRGVDEVRACLVREYDVRLAEGIRTMPGAARLVALAAAKRPLGCASNSQAEELEGKLRGGGLREHFTVLESSESVARPKPAPDMYASAARRLGCDPADALAFEDSAVGAQAARDAGLRLIAVPAPGHEAPPADLALGSLEDPDLLAWVDSW